MMTTVLVEVEGGVAQSEDDLRIESGFKDMAAADASSAYVEDGEKKKYAHLLQPIRCVHILLARCPATTAR